MDGRGSLVSAEPGDARGVMRARHVPVALSSTLLKNHKIRNETILW